MTRKLEKYMYQCVRCGKLETVANYLDDIETSGSNGFCICQYFDENDGSTTGTLNEMKKVNVSKIIGERFSNLIDNYAFVDEENLPTKAKELKNKLLKLCKYHLGIDIVEGTV